MNENATRKPVTSLIKKPNKVYFKFPSFNIAELRDQIVSVQEEKKVLAIELENLKSKLVEVMEEVGTSGPAHGFVNFPSLRSFSHSEKVQKARP